MHSPSKSLCGAYPTSKRQSCGNTSGRGSGPHSCHSLGVKNTIALSALSAPRDSVSPPTDPPIRALANFSKGNYKYTATLLVLEATSPTRPNVPYDDQVSTPLCLDAWERSLCTIPDRQFAQFLLRGIRTGFRIGVAEGAVFKPSHRNLRSAYEHPQVITAYLQCEVNLGRMQIIPTGSQLAPPLLQLSPFGAIPKKYKPDTWRLIVDLSSPRGFQ